MNIYDPPEMQDSVEAWRQYADQLKGERHAEERARADKVIAQKAELALKG